ARTNFGTGLASPYVVGAPGFNDTHAHSVWFGMRLIETDLSGVRSLDDLYRIIGDRARDGGADEWIVASGFNPLLVHRAGPGPDRLPHPRLSPRRAPGRGRPRPRQGRPAGVDQARLRPLLPAQRRGPAAHRRSGTPRPGDRRRPDRA